MMGIFFFVTSVYFVVLSFVSLLDVLFFFGMFYSGNFFSFLLYFTIFRPGTVIWRLFGSVYVYHIPHIFRILVAVYTGLDGVQTSHICNILMDSGCKVLRLFFGIQFWFLLEFCECWKLVCVYLYLLFLRIF